MRWNGVVGYSAPVPHEHAPAHAAHPRACVSVGKLEGVELGKALEDLVLLCAYAVELGSGDVIFGLLSDGCVE